MSAPVWSSSDGSLEVYRDSTPEGPRLSVHAPDVGEVPIQFLDRTEALALVSALTDWLDTDCGVRPELTAWEARQLAGWSATSPGGVGPRLAQALTDAGWRPPTTGGAPA